jgi:hypothetical protein
MMHEPTDVAPPATDLRSAYQNCEAGPLPADHPWYVDFGPARGGSMVAQLARRLELKPPGEVGARATWLQGVVVGPRGSGKSSDLRRLKAAVRGRYEVVLLDLNNEVNPAEFELAELVLAIAMGVERHMREFVHKPLPDALLARLVDWFSRVTREDLRTRVVEVGTNWGLLKSVLGMLKVQSEARTTVVRELKRYPGELVVECNLLLAAAQDLLEPGRELLVVVDNLDRYEPEVVNRSLCDGRDLLGALDSNLLLTPPVSLALRPVGESLDSLYEPVVVLPTPALRGPKDPPETVKDPGRALFTDALQRRIDLPAVFAEPERAVPHLLALTGGSLRDLWEHLREAIVVAAGPKVTVEDLDTALRRRISLLRDQVDTSGMVEMLVEVHRAGRLQPNQAALEAVFRRWLLKYNSSDWYALHPYVLAMPRVQELLAAKASP